jgi:uncharacterized protein involved in outer membrane biogenesis
MQAMKKIIRILLGVVVLLIVVAVVAFLFIGTIVKSGVEKVGPIVTKVPVTLDSAKISVFGGSGELKEFVLGNPEGYKTPRAIKVGKISVALVPSSVMKDKKVIRQIRVEAPEITYETDFKGSNLGKVLENVQGSARQDEKAPTKDQQATKTKLQVDDFAIIGARVTVAASMLGGQGATLMLPEIHLKDLGTGPDGITPAELSEKVLSAIVNETSKAIAANTGKLGEGGKALGTSAVDQLKKSAGGLFKK